MSSFTYITSAAVQLRGWLLILTEGGGGGGGEVKALLTLSLANFTKNRKLLYIFTLYYQKIL